MNLDELLEVAGMGIGVRLQKSRQQIELKYYDVPSIAIAIVKTNDNTSSSLFHGSTIANMQGALYQPVYVLYVHNRYLTFFMSMCDPRSVLDIRAQETVQPNS